MRRLILQDPNLSRDYERDLADGEDAREMAVALATHAYHADPWITVPDGGWPGDQMREWAFMWTIIRTNEGARSVVAEHELEAARNAAIGLDKTSNPNVDIEEV